MTGLAANAADFPTPPVSSVELQAILDSFITLCGEQVASQSAAEQVTETKTAGKEELVTAMRAVLRYAEDAVNYDDPKLSALGWGDQAAPTALQIPGQPRALEASKQGEGWVFLDWKKPADGGKVSAYLIERRERSVGDWILVSSEMITEGTLNNQERGKDWEFRVVAKNRVGVGVPSNTVTAVL